MIKSNSVDTLSTNENLVDKWNYNCKKMSQSIQNDDTPPMGVIASPSQRVNATSQPTTQIILNKNLSSIKRINSYESDGNASVNLSSFALDQNNNKCEISNSKRTKKKHSNRNSNSVQKSSKNSTTSTHEENIKQQKKFIIEYPFKPIDHQSDRPNILLNFFKLTILFLTNLFIFMPIILSLMLILVPLKYISRALFKILHFCHLTDSSHLSPTHLPEFLNPTELFWLYNSSLNKQTSSLIGTKSIGACLFFIEGYLPKHTIRDLIFNRIIQANSRSNLGEFNRFSERVLNVFGFGYVWVKTNEFNLDEHIIEIENTSSLKTDLDLQAHISNLMRTHTFSLNKPLWSLYYIKSYGQNLNDKTTVLIFLYHQSFASGVSLIRLFLKGIVDNRNAIDLKPRFAYFNLSFSLLKQCVFGWSKILYYLFFKSNDNNPLHNKYFKSDRYKNLNLKAEKTSLNSYNDAQNKEVLTWSEPFSLVLINRLKLVTRSKMNDLLISVLSGILRNYLQLKGINNPHDMHMIMPVDLSSNKFPFKLSNRSTLVSFQMPVNTEGCIPRLWSTRSQTSHLKQSNNYSFFYFLINVLFNLLPNKFAFYLIRNMLNKNTFIASTLGAGDSSLSTLSLCNRNVKSLIYFYPTICNVSISLSIVTYGDEIRLSVLADANLISNPELITTEFIKQLETLTDLLSNRRIPGDIRRILKPQIEASNTPSSDVSDRSIEDMQQKMADIQQELQVLTEHLDNLNSGSLDYLKQKQIVLIKSEKLRKEFRNILVRLQVKQNLNSQTIPSDDEDELDPNERIRLRSSSIASRASLGSNILSKKNRDSHSSSDNSHIEKHDSSRKHSICGNNSRQGSLSFSSGVSNEIGNSGGPTPNANVSAYNLNCLTVENEYVIGNKQNHHHHHTQTKTNFYSSHAYVVNANCNSNYLSSSYQNQFTKQNSIGSNARQANVCDFFEEDLYNAQLNSD